MCSRTFISLFLALTVLLASCRNEQNDKIINQLSHADSVIFSNPHESDSILHLIESDVKRLDMDVKMRYAMLYADVKNKLYDTMPAPKDFFKVVEYYDENGTQDEKIRSHYLLGCIYRDIGDAPEALKCYYDAINMVSDSATCNKKYVMCVWGQMADVYRTQRIWKEEHKARLKYIEYARMIGDIGQELLGYEHLIKNYLMLGDEKTVLELSRKVAERYHAKGLDYLAGGVYPYAIDIYLDKGNYAKAHELMMKVERESDMFDKNHNITDDRQVYYYHIGRYHLGIHQYDSAEYYFRKLAQYGELTKSYNGLMRLYYEKHNTDSLYKYTRLYALSVEQSMDELQARSVYEMRSLYNYSHYKSDMLALSVKSQHNMLCFCIVGVVMFFAVCASYYGFNKRYRQKKREIEIISRKYHFTERQNQQLTDSLRQHTFTNAEECVFETELGNCIRNNPCFFSNADWNEVYQLLREYMPCFYNIIRTSRLTLQERQVCILIRLGCTTQSIMTILHIAHTSGVSNVKRSANKKLFHNDNTRAMYDSIISLEKEMMCASLVSE